MPCTRAIASSSALPPWPPQTSHPASTEDSFSDQNIASWPIHHYQIGCPPKFSHIHQTSSFIAYTLHAMKLHSPNNHTPKPPLHTQNQSHPLPYPCYSLGQGASKRAVFWSVTCTGTVLGFATPGHTVYATCNAHGLFIVRWVHLFFWLFLVQSNTSVTLWHRHVMLLLWAPLSIKILQVSYD